MYKKSEKEGLANFVSWTVGGILGFMFLLFIFWFDDWMTSNGESSGGALFPIVFIGVMMIFVMIDKIYSLIIGEDEPEK